MSVVVHVVVVGALLMLPPLTDVPVEGQNEVIERLRPEPAPEDDARFVFVQPRVDLPAERPPERAELSDLDRRAQAPELPTMPANPLPFARGNSAERIEAAPELRARGSGPDPDPSDPAPEAPEEIIERLPETSDRASVARPREEPARPQGGSLGEALKNLQEYVQRESFNNPQGGTNEFGPHIQFDTKGVEFGPWIRRFVAQVRRNWFVPNAAMLMRGRVVIQFNVHKDGRITDLTVVSPANVESFNTAALNALLSSNPTYALPPEYPADQAFFTVTFFYNESPGPQQ